MEHSGGEVDSLGHVCFMCRESATPPEHLLCLPEPFYTPWPWGEDAPLQPFSQSLLQGGLCRAQHPGAVGGARLGLLW